ncbi:MAG: polysaccharide deacetylase family protein [Acidobacteriaceae bacterium]
MTTMTSHSIPLARVHRRPLARRVLGYHEFSQGGSQDVYQLAPERFAEQIAAVQTAAMQANQELEITFDDADRSQVELAAPLLEQAGMTGIFFVPAGWVGVRPQTASWSDLHALVRSGHTIGSHGQTHTLLTHCSPATLEAELVGSRKTLEDRLGCAVQSISVPGGRWNAAVASACLAAGYTQIYTSQPGPALAQNFAEPQELLTIVGRLIVRRRMPVSTLASYAAGNWLVTAHLRTEYQAKQALKRLVGDVGYQTLWRRLLRSPVQSAGEPTALL